LGIGIGEIFAGRLPAQAEGLGDFTHREALMRSAVDLKDGAFVNQGWRPKRGG
jgi:hypothetical protein